MALTLESLVILTTFSIQQRSVLFRPPVGYVLSRIVHSHGDLSGNV